MSSTTVQQMNNLQALPFEILCCIFDFIDQDASKNQTYCDLAQTCSLLYRSCVPRLYRSISIGHSLDEQVGRDNASLYLLARTFVRGAASASRHHGRISQDLALHVQDLSIGFLSCDKSVYNTHDCKSSNKSCSCAFTVPDLRTMVNEVALNQIPRSTMVSKAAFHPVYQSTNIQGYISSCIGRNDLCTAWILQHCLNLKSVGLYFTHGSSRCNFIYQVFRDTRYEQLQDLLFDGCYFRSSMCLDLDPYLLDNAFDSSRGSLASVKKLKLTNMGHLELIQSPPNNRCTVLRGLTELVLDNWNVLHTVIPYTPELKILRIHNSLGCPVPTSFGTVNRDGKLCDALARIKETIEELEMSMYCASDPTGVYHEVRVYIAQPFNFHSFHNLKRLKIPLPMLFCNSPANNYLSTVLPPQLEELEVTDDVQGHKMRLPVHYFAAFSYLFYYVLEFRSRGNQWMIFALRKIKLHMKRPMVVNIALGMNLIPAFRAAHVNLLLSYDTVPLGEAERLEFVEDVRCAYNKAENAQE